MKLRRCLCGSVFFEYGWVDFALCACACVCLCVCVCVCVCVCEFIVRIHGVSSQRSAFVCLCLCVYACVCVCMCVSVYLHVRVQMSTRAIAGCKCVFACVCVYMAIDALMNGKDFNITRTTSILYVWE